MIGFEGRLRWRQQKLFKLHAKLPQCEIRINFNILPALPETFAGASSHRKFAIRLFIE
jgi:hypothetical protein